MAKINRNDVCPCGSGLKYKKCCGVKKSSKLEGLKAAIRMKGGVRYSAEKNGFIAIVHTWDNIECHGEPEEWNSPEVFPTEDTAMEYYKTYIRASLQRMMAELKEKNSNIKSIHRKLE